MPALRRMRYDTTSGGVSEELVEGVVDMQLCYGVSETQGLSVDSYVQADAVDDWTNVAAIRVSLVMISPEVNVATEPPSVQYMECDGTVTTRSELDYPEFGDRRLSRVFSTTVGLRNVLQ